MLFGERVAAIIPSLIMGFKYFLVEVVEIEISESFSHETFMVASN